MRVRGVICGSIFYRFINSGEFINFVINKKDGEVTN